MTANTCDLLLTGGTVIDGTGAPRLRADVAVRDDRVAAVGDLADWRAARRLTSAAMSSPPASSTCTPMTTTRCSPNRIWI